MSRNELSILIVDDDEEFCEEIAEALTEEGYAAGYACDRNAVDKKISAENFSLVLLDIKMKEENGIDVLKRLKQKQPQAKVFIVSGKPHSESLSPSLCCP
ncbi:MAG: response regulator [Candidatus Omnitrophica bacterium]|nr:response regulator [Candidatus Omnitrophota bacterium]MCG2703293.1 response regulator [Candidatus Omnitrophota bacterium]